jgi:superoxide reductase
MTQAGEIYKCKICGSIVQVKQDGVGTLVCCNQDMELFSDGIEITEEQ